MDLSGIFTIGGKPGLNKLVAQSKNGVIVESLVDHKRFNASSTSKISSLEDISVFCLEGDKPLKDTLEVIGEASDFKEIDVPSDEGLKDALKKYLPTFDQDRVYNSDVKKIFKWYNSLIGAKLLKKEAKKTEKTEDEEKKGAAKKATTKKAKAPIKNAPNVKIASRKGGAQKSSAAKKNG
jgi:hypothetical protein